MSSINTLIKRGGDFIRVLNDGMEMYRKMGENEGHLIAGVGGIGDNLQGEGGGEGGQN